VSSKTLLIIGFVWPEPNSSAAGIRMLQLINLFIEQGFEITFVTAANHSDKTFDLSSQKQKLVFYIFFNNSVRKQSNRVFTLYV